MRLEANWYYSEAILNYERASELDVPNLLYYNGNCVALYYVIIQYYERVTKLGNSIVINKLKRLNRILS